MSDFTCTSNFCWFTPMTISEYILWIFIACRVKFLPHNAVFPTAWGGGIHEDQSSCKYYFFCSFKKLVWVELVIIFTGIVYLRILSLDLMGLSLIFILLSQVFRGSCDEFRHFKSCDTRSHEGRVTRPDSETEDLHYRQSQWQDHPLSTHATDGLRVLAQVMNRCRVKRFLQFYLWF